MDLVFGQTDAIVGERQCRRLARPLVNVDDHLAAVPQLQIRAGADRIDAVLEQLADEDVGLAVKMVRQQVDQPAEVNLEFMVHCGRSRLVRGFVEVIMVGGCRRIQGSIHRIADQSDDG